MPSSWRSGSQGVLHMLLLLRASAPCAFRCGRFVDVFFFSASSAVCRRRPQGQSECYWEILDGLSRNRSSLFGWQHSFQLEFAININARTHPFAQTGCSVSDTHRPRVAQLSVSLVAFYHYPKGSPIQGQTNVCQPEFRISFGDSFQSKLKPTSTVQLAFPTETFSSSLWRHLDVCRWFVLGLTWSPNSFPLVSHWS